MGWGQSLRCNLTHGVHPGKKGRRDASAPREEAFNLGALASRRLLLFRAHQPEWYGYCTELTRNCPPSQ